jgi:hypothetical protein
MDDFDVVAEWWWLQQAIDPTRVLPARDDMERMFQERYDEWQARREPVRRTP